MGFERRLRNVIVRTPLADSTIVGQSYRRLNTVRFRRRWERPVEFRGAQFVIGEDLSLYPFVRSGGFEERELDWLLPRVREAAICWDVGANVGLYTVLLARRAPAGLVVAFEPVPALRQRLQGNLAMNDVHNVIVAPVALGDSVGTASMAVPLTAAGGSHLTDDDDDHAIEVLMMTADAQAKEVGRMPDIVKVDIEGHEPAFVRGARRLLSHARPLLLLEVNTSTFPLHGPRRQEWDEMLDHLFDLYGDATLFAPADVRQVRQLQLDELPQRPHTLAFDNDVQVQSPLSEDGSGAGGT